MTLSKNILAFSLLLNVNLFIAQESSNTSGGEATGIGGTASYSVGQVVYTTNTGSNGSVAQGVQQPYEISTLADLTTLESITLEMSVQPNPTVDFLVLKIDNAGADTFSYILYDENGKDVLTGKLTESESVLSMQELQPAAYFLKVTSVQRKQVVKSFKVIKN